MAIAMPGPGFRNPRTHVLGPKIDLLLLGALRLVRAKKADNSVRLRSSGPTSMDSMRSSDNVLRSSRIGFTSG
jgi:hypothetical protein